MLVQTLTHAHFQYSTLDYKTTSVKSCVVLCGGNGGKNKHTNTNTHTEATVLITVF